MKRLHDLLWLLLWASLSTGWILSAARDLSATFDEPFYLRSSLKSWRTGSNFDLMRAGTMPLAMDVQYLPVYLWEQVRGEPFDEEAEFHRLLAVGRATNLFFWWLLLAYGFRVANLFGGPWAGRLAVAFLATEPSLLGHACLATTDIAITALMLVFTFHYQVGRTGGRFRRWFLPGVLYGVAVAAKASALTFVPIVMFALALPNWWAKRIWSPPPGVGRVRHAWREVRPLWGDFWKMFVVGTVVLWGYCGCDWDRLPSFVKWADGVRDQAWGPRARWAADHMRIFPNAGQGLVYQIKHNMRGHDGVFLLGHWYVRSVWYYFPVALVIKFSLPVLGLFLLLLTRPRAFATPLAVVVVILFLFTLTVRVQIGIRLIFPFMAFFLILLAVALSRVMASRTHPFRTKPAKPHRGGGGGSLDPQEAAPTAAAVGLSGFLKKDRSRWVALLLLSGVLVVPAIRTWPDGLRYVNELWGGPANVHLILSDSNSDWGQGLIDLDRWTDQRGLPPARVWYYGSDPKLIPRKNPETPEGFGRLLPLEYGAFYPLETPEDTAKHVRGHLVAVGKTILGGFPTITPTMPLALEFFRTQTPVGETRSFFIYDFRDP